ncbi:uncharacterized protein LOC135074394 [Ostrinia nubilalis]|uniref:uncharacterized protein LOC135074394 n=1 Tax=Ostrinia nubilalis TaxID=29057 RepID=UPI0030824A66
MNGYPKPLAERLYLYRDEDDEIFVDALLHQHQIDGIRFLYKQFTKKSPGVVINNPLGYGNSMIVALFLGAIRHLLEKPILIICEDGQALNWLEHFQKLTHCYNVGIAAESPFVKKSIFINTMARLEQFSRREWSVMVVDNAAFLKEKTIQAKYKADFKIWITPDDMKDHLDTFASIHKWLFPNEKLNIDDLKAKPGDIKDTIAKTKFLDAFLQDKVFRTHLLTPFENPYSKSERTSTQVSKKNKDATGTKIKRSKRTSECASTSTAVPSTSDMVPGPSAVKIPRKETQDNAADDFTIDNFKNNKESTTVTPDSDDKTPEMDVESFIRNEEPVQYDPFKKFMQDYDNISHHSEEESRPEFIEQEPQIFQSPEKLEGIKVSSGVPMDFTENVESCLVDSDTNSDNLMQRPNFFVETSQDTNVSDYDIECKLQSTPPDFLTDNILNEMKDELSETNNSDSNNDSKPEETTKEEPEQVEESPKKDLNSKMKEMDDQVMKKFQGSLLDRLF